MYKLFLTLRYLHQRRIAYLAIAAVTLCVAMLLIVLSVIGGWEEMVKSQSRRTLGDLVISSTGSAAGLPLYEEFINEIKTWPDAAGRRLIKEATPVRYTPGLFRFAGSGQTGVVQVVGIRLKQAFEVTEFGKGLSYESSFPGTTSLTSQGELPPEIGGNAAETHAAAESRPGIIFGREIVTRGDANNEPKRSYVRGELVYLTILPLPTGAGVDLGMPVKKQFRCIDDSRTGIYDFDSRHVYCDFDLLQGLLNKQTPPRTDDQGRVTGLGPQHCSQIQVKLAQELGESDVKALAARMTETYRSYAFDPRFENVLDPGDRSELRSLNAVPGQETQARLLAIVEKERMLVSMLFGIVSLVSVTVVMCILYMIVLQKTREIGIIKSLGGSSGGVALTFVMYGATVGGVAAGLGTVLGTVVVSYINEIQDFLVLLSPSFRVWETRVYSLARIPDTVNVWEALAIMAFAVAASAVGSLGAAWRAGQMQPVAAIRED